VYQILHVRVRAGPSPRPGNWILEKSIDGIEYLPWQYFAVSGDECLARYGARPTHPAHILRIPGRPPCVTAFSKVTPFEGGEINVGLTQGWPNGSLASPEMAFHTSARFIRIKIQKLSSHKFEKTRHSHGSDLVNRFYYTIKDILIQGRCNCSGHAHRCPYDLMLGKSVCECAHKTTGEHCEECLPLYNQRQWKPGTPKEANACLKCECYGHARSCIYDPTIESSISYDGQSRGGGVCIGCEAHTSGVNCESCEDGWYRPAGVPLNASKPCVPCECNLRGSTGFCWKDDSEVHLNKLPGICECLEGFTGRKCDRCAPGYRGFPDCTKCDCDLEGLLPGSLCDSQCVCKPNFDGKRCDRCKPGYFLMAEPQGSVECRECYCSGLKVECERASGYSVTEFMTMEGWQVSDLLTSYIVQPYNRFPKSHQISIADTQMSGLVYYYWMAPPPYTGNKLTSYGSTITFSVSWDYRRGDTSGKETSGPDLVLIGHNGLRIGYGSMQHKEANLNITIPLVEDGWYHVLDDVGDMVTRLKRNQGNWVEYRGDDISRGQLLSVLANIKHMLVRAKYHTDQAEGSLYACSIELGSEGGSGTAVGFIEKCFCPVGNAGLSCERCDYGFTRIMDGVSPMHKVVCSKCNCHGHSPTCDPISGQCAMCEHNTTGSVCDKCAEGYYGDATNGSPNDCRQCACPFIEPSNNFSPTCVADHLGYVCTACPEGYTGRHCEQCAPGYFGSPEEIGSTCKPCNCNDGPCDHLTGRCLSCLGNTQGWKCDKCKPNHYGNASTTGCFPCGCSPIGSEFSEGCNLEDGQCHCKERFTGRTCDRCETGFGNISAGCVACNCDSIGAKSSLCDSVTGACECQPGVTGLSCHTCLPEHYGYSESGCKRCNCDPLGSESSECDIITGECKCKPRVEGRTCNECHLGFWGLGPSGCTPCNCDTLGSMNSSCDQTTGQCYCKPGVGNQKCDHCSPLYYNMSSEGCTECDLCELPGRICDPDTGACVCPPLTAGDFCQGCEINAWGYNPQKGCKPCDCDPFGSLGERCDALAGRCTCKEGYTGPKCQSCAKGYFGHPSCKKCECNIAGTQSHHCHDGVCECDGTGQCPCKDLVTGQRCNKCKDGTFGLLAENSKGCTECFCFNRSTVCTDAHLEWTEIRMGRPRIIMINYDNETVPDNVIYPVDTQEICYINLAMPGNNGMVKKEEKFLNITNNLRIIPGQLGNVELGVSYWFDSPVYWQLSNDFLGDKVLSYGGYLRFTVETNGGSTQFPESVLSSYPLIQIQGNDRIVLEHFPYKGKHHSGRHNVRLHETQWRMKNNPRDYVSRQTMMLALQNLQHILIRASDSMDFVEARLREVTLDTAIAFPTTRAPSTTGIELCECPKNYNATSCQNPSLGFYRWRSGEVTSTIIIDLIGEAKPCECNNRSSTCDMETGKCLDCADNTGGHWCESCAEGYYGDPGQGVACKACPCPSEARNFATSCQVFEDGNRSCFCKEGYTGQYCDRCSYGYYGHPANGGTCKRCTCHPFGRISEGCDESTGQCTCREGVTGWDCSTCVDKLNVLSEDGCTVKDSSIDTTAECNEVIKYTENVEDEVFSLRFNITHKLRPALDALEADGEVSLNTARELIDEAHANMKQTQDVIDQMAFTSKKQSHQFEKWNNTIASKLEALRNKITRAHHNANRDDFVAVEMINRKIRFVWNVGGGLGEVTHPMHIQTAGDLNKDQHWYRVQAERVSNIGYLWVRPVVVPEGSLLKDSPPVTNASSPGVGRFDVGQGDRVWVGGADRRHPHLLSTQSGLVGCLHHLFLNGRPIGLWDFDTQNPHSCTACVEGAQEVVDESSYSFAGDGYAVVTHDNSGVFNKYLFSVSLKFKTFDHNALLFMGSENGTGRFVSLTLKNGRVVFKIGYGGDSSLEMSTIEKYNNGKWTRIEASRYFDRKKKLEKGVLKVSNEVRDGAPSVPPNQDSIPDMSMAKYYVGGVPPGEKDLPPNIRAFLGCMSDVQIDQGAYSLLKGKYWGMQPSCSSKPITVAGFFGNGFIELPSHSLKKKDNFGFVFSSAQRDALLMLSTFEGGDKLSYYSVSLRRGQIDVRLNAGKGEVRLASVSSEYGDSKYHTINVAKVGKRLELRVDDVLDAVTMLPEGSTTFKANGESGGLFFGGLPTGFNTTGRTFSNIPFVGTIKDIIFSDKVYGFDEPLRFEDVTIGRFGPTTTQPRLNEPSNSISTGCRKVLSYSIDPRAVSFGDEPFSHVQISFRKRAVLQKNFSLELDFRTFYQNGLIFMIPGVRNKQPHYLMAALRNGRVQIVLKGRRKIETTAQAVFNDGMWHNLVLEKEDRRMTLRIDSIDPEKTKTPKKMNVGNVMYIGGLPETGVQLPNNLVKNLVSTSISYRRNYFNGYININHLLQINKLEGFKGCVRALKVNGREEPLMVEKTVPYPKVGQCFPQVERGSYFPGDAFAIYKKKFNVGSLLELELEFRTSEMNGILLSVAEPQGYPALSLELNNGKVIMSGDMGDRRPFRVVQEFESEFAVCDNRWHRVQAHYVNDELSLRVDDRDQSYWLSDNGHLTATTTNSPLYIGGIPDYASIGTLGTREYFKGCIRNVIISGERRDWTAMAALHNVLHTSCPLPPS
ncbi:unnamed protein product, partial [Nesidiocoris tenuis]